MAPMTTFETARLSNGLRVVTAPMPQAKSVACFVMVAAGSRYETRETNGIAHFAEHMFFKGTERRPRAKDIAGEIDALRPPFNLSGFEARMDAIPALGAHTGAILSELGYTQADIEALRAAGAL